MRVDKEIQLLKNLPKEYKLGKRETALGTLLYLEIDKSAVNLDATATQNEVVPIQKYNFDILLREKYPFEAPQITTRTRVSNGMLILLQFGPVPLADGRDLFCEILSSDQKWNPQMTIYELI
jgi:ubiquitin-protein ligase